MLQCSRILMTHRAAPAVGLQAAEVRLEAGGVPYSPQYGDVYASRDGALGQARHVFLVGNGLPDRWSGRARFAVLETGFGLGTNFLAAWHAWRDDPRRPARLDFVSIERHPVAPADLLRAAEAAGDATLGALARELSAAWPLALAGLHRLAFDGDRVVLTLALGDANELLPKLVGGFDAFFLDGFAPERNPELWSPALLRGLARLARADATLATWCTARPVRDALGAAGFALERRPGYGRKREMLAGRFAPRWTVRRHAPPVAEPGADAARHALVIGAGIAGHAAAHALALRGWTVEQLERADAPASGASGLPWGLVHPQITPDDSRLARLTRAGALAAVRELGALARGGFDGWRDGGVLELVAEPTAAAALRAAIDAQCLPPGYARWLDPRAASEAAGVPLAQGGVWFAAAGAVSASRWGAAQRDAQTSRWRLRTGRPVAHLARRGGAWCALDDHGAVLAEAPTAIVAAATDSARLLLGGAAGPDRDAAAAREADALDGPALRDPLPHAAILGRVTGLAPGALPALRVALAGDGTLVRGADGWLGVGASFEIAALADEAAHAGNRARLARLLGVPPDDPALDALAPPHSAWSGVRCVAHDRLPWVGPMVDAPAAWHARAALRGAHLHELPRVPGLYVLSALGSRGLTLAALCGELLAAQIEATPWPVEHDLADALDPARVLLRRLRQPASTTAARAGA